MDSKTRKELQEFQKRIIRWCAARRAEGIEITWAEGVAAIEAEDAR